MPTKAKKPPLMNLRFRLAGLCIVDLEIDLPDILIPTLTEPARYRVAYGGRGSSKSWSFGRALIGRAMERPTRWLCAREYQTSIRESVHHLLASQIETLGLTSYFRVMQDEIRGPNGSLFVYAGLHDKSLDSLKSYEGFDGCWIEEGQSVSRRSLQFLKPTIRKDGSEIWITMNPENENDPVYTDFILNPPDNALVQKVNWYDNKWFNSVLEDEKKADYARDPQAADWIWGGNCRSISDKQVLRGKCETKPFIPNPGLWDGPYQGIDWGFAQDPTCMIRCWIWEGDLYIEYEAFGEHTEIEHHPALFSCIPDSDKFVSRADNARPEMVNYMIRNGFPRVRNAQKWPGCVEDRISHLRSFNRIYIHPRCPKIEKEGKLWSWKTNRAGDILNVLVPGNDHGWDAVGYALEPFIKVVKKAPVDNSAPIPSANRW